MAIPSQVKAQREHIEKLYTKPKEGKDAGDPPQQAENARDQSAQDQSQQAQPDQVDDQQDSDTDESSDGVVSDDAQNSVAELRAELDKANQRYQTMAGMVRSKDDDLQQMRAILSQVQNNHDTKSQLDKQSSAAQQDPHEAQDRKDFGDEYIDMVARAVDRKLGNLVNRVQKLEQHSTAVDAVTKETQRDQFHRKLNELVPDWQQIDATQEFADWLQQSPSRVAFVKQGMANYDAQGIAGIFEQYKVTSGTGEPGDKSAQKPAKSLERKTAPSKGRASNPKGGDKQKVWTRSEIAQVYRDRRNIPAKEFAELERDIFSAQRENRVDYSQ